MEEREAVPRCLRDSGGYRRREPENSLLYRVVATHLDVFLARAADLADGSGLPAFVERELRAFLKCGILEHGFVRVHCDACGKDALVAFSCKGRGFCPSCGGRRMAATAAHLVDRVLPHVPVRQWVLSLPIRLRYQIAFDRELCRRVRNLFVRGVLGWMRRRALHAGVPYPEVGAVTAVQRFGSAMNLNVHFHTLVLDGAFRSDLRGGLHFVALDAPAEAELARLLTSIRSRVQTLLRRRGLLLEPTDDFDLHDASSSPALAACTAASLVHRVALGSHSGQPIPRRRQRQRERARPCTTPKEGCVDLDGYSLHANVRVAARDRGRLERLARYLVRPAISDARLALTEDGRIALELKTPYRDGTTHFVLDAMTFLERLAALVPPPRAHLVVYHGVLASAAAIRHHVVPHPPAGAAAAGTSVNQDDHATAEHAQPTADVTEATRAVHSRNYTWAELMKRVFLFDVLRCDCGGSRRLIATITDAATIARILRCLGLLGSSPARGPPQDVATALCASPAPHSSEPRVVLD